MAALERHPEHTSPTRTRPTLGKDGQLPIEDFDPETLTERNYIHASALMRRSAFELVGGYDVGMRTSRYEDWDLLHGSLSAGCAVLRFAGRCCKYRKHPVASRGAHLNFARWAAWRAKRLQLTVGINHPRLFAPRALIGRISRLPGRLLRREVSAHFSVLFLGITIVMRDARARSARRPGPSLRAAVFADRHLWRPSGRDNVRQPQ